MANEIKYKEEIEKREQAIKEIEDNINDIVEHECVGFEGDEDYDYEYESMINSPQYRLDDLQGRKEQIEQEILRLKADAQIKDSYKIFEIKKKTYKKGTLATDNETQNDLLSRSLYSQVLAEYILSKKTDTPFNIGVFGAWGEGKSSFLKLIEQKIGDLSRESKGDENYKTHIVRYDASEYSEQNKIWACILKELFSKFEEEKGFMAKLLFSYKRIKKEIKNNSWKYIIRVITVIIIFFWGYIFSKNIENIKEIKKILLYGSIGIIPLVMGIVNVIIPFIKSQIKIAKPLSDMVETSINLPSYTKDLGIRENIKEDLEDLLDAWLKKDKINKKYNERLVIFIDELDRASEKGILELLEALQLFLSMKQIVIILSVNLKSVCYALRNKFKHINSDSMQESDRIRFCMNYLEKYINIPIYLNYEGTYDQYISKLINEENNFCTNLSVKKEVAVSDVKEILREEKKFVFDSRERKIVNESLNRINGIKHITPREVKKVVNILVLSKQICMNINEVSLYKEKIEFENYIRWFVFAYFNPITSFNLLKVVDKEEYYLTIGNIKFDGIQKDKDTERETIYEKSEPLAQEMLDELKEIKVNEIKMFKEISNKFIFNEHNF